MQVPLGIGGVNMLIEDISRRPEGRVVLAIVMLLGASIFLFVPSAPPVEGLTVPGGDLNGQTVWDMASSPVSVQGNVTIPSGSSLTIKAGVVVEMDASFRMEVIGSLSVQGSPGNEVVIRGNGGSFDQVLVSSGGHARIEHADMNGTSHGIVVNGAASIAHVLNTTIVSDGSGVSCLSDGTGWLVNSTVSGSPRLSVIGGYLHECYWFEFMAMKDNNGGPLGGAKLKVMVNYFSGAIRDAYDAIGSGDPATGSDGRLAPIMVEIHFHEGSVSSFDCTLRLRMTATEGTRSWLKNDDVNVTGNLFYLWTVDNTAPPKTTGLSIDSVSGTSIGVSWSWDHDVQEHQLNWFVVHSWQKYSSAIESYDTVLKSARSHVITSLETETVYDIEVFTEDVWGNRNISDTVTVQTLDVTAPSAPTLPTAINGEGVQVILGWNISADTDTAGYRIYMNDTDGEPVFFLFVEGRITDEVSIENLTSETDYTFWISAIDGADPPNESPLVRTVSVRTPDITPPPAPVLELYLVSPLQYLPGSEFYNRTYVGIKGTVHGENRTFIEIYIDGALEEFDNPAEAPTTYEGVFVHYMFLTPGTHVIRARSIDAPPSMNAGELSAPLNITIDLISPLIDLGTELMDVDAGTDVVLFANLTDSSGIHEVTWKVRKDDTVTTVMGNPTTVNLEIGMHEVECIAFDKAGNMGSSTFNIRSWIPDHILPTVVRTSPEDNSTGVEVDSRIEIVFSELLRWDGIVARLYPSGEPSSQVALTPDHDTSNLTLVFIPEELDPLTGYTFEMTGIRDVRGNPGPDLAIVFKTIDPALIDSDGDSIPNVFEVRKTFLSPSDPSDAGQDQDGDGLTNLEEYRLGTDLEVTDTDEDGMPDGWEVLYGFDPLDKSDAIEDEDGDGYKNNEEYEDGTDPLDPSSHRDESSSDLIWLLILAVVVIVIIVAAVIVIVFMKRKDVVDQSSVSEAGPEDEAIGAEQDMTGPEEPPERFCSSCGATVDAELDYCPECGTELPTEDVPDISQVPSDIGPYDDMPSMEGGPAMDDGTLEGAPGMED